MAIAESFRIYFKIEMGYAVNKWECMFGKKSKELMAQLSPEQLKYYERFRFLGLGIGCFGINGLGVIFLIVFLLSC